uniref:E2 NEDD8-conjugating enzyme n=1 Tax=Phallusia mammillata TaxID=59560 RepID=A0A6F9DWM2_9ASCI|nr:NEDD8-conjugating enzyme UBE2F-like [Phallusia mammillata]
MITLSKKLKEARNQKENGSITNSAQPTATRSGLIRDKLLTREFADIDKQKSETWKLSFEDPNVLHQFTVTIAPDEGLWKGGKYKFSVNIPEEYNIKPPQVRCLTKLWHPNISMEGAVCLSILRDHSLDGTGWAPTRSIRDVIWGLCSLFTDLVDFDDPLNTEAAEEHRRDRKKFERSVEFYLYRYAV